MRFRIANNRVEHAHVVRSTRKGDVPLLGSLGTLCGGERMNQADAERLHILMLQSSEKLRIGRIVLNLRNIVTPDAGVVIYRVTYATYM